MDRLTWRVLARFLCGGESTPEEITRKIRKWESDIADWESQLAHDKKNPALTRSIETMLPKFRNLVVQLRKELAEKAH